MLYNKGELFTNNQIQNILTMCPVDIDIYIFKNGYEFMKHNIIHKFVSLPILKVFIQKVLGYFVYNKILHKKPEIYLFENNFIGDFKGKQITFIFVLFHEIKHYYIYKNKEIKNTKEEESCADKFAANLILNNSDFISKIVGTNIKELSFDI